MQYNLARDCGVIFFRPLAAFVDLSAQQAMHRIIGVRLLADHADTLIAESIVMVSADLHAHPTQTELFGDLMRAK